MSEDKQNRTAIIAVVTGIIALLLGLCVGGVLGGAGGYFVGRSSTTKAVETVRPERTVVPRPQRSTPALPQQPTPAQPEQRLPGNLPQSGAVIQEVIQDTPAATAGLRRNDVIVRAGDTPIDADHALADVLAGYKPGDTVTLTIWRMGSTRTIDVRLGAHPDDASRSYLGIRYGELAPQP